MTLTPQSEDFSDYLAEDEIIDHGHAAIRELAGRLRRADAEQTAAAVFAYVRDEIEHSYDLGRWSAAYRASDVLAAGSSICHGQAHLLTALLRAEGIPTGLCYQMLTAMHGLVAVHWPAGWVRLDPRSPAAGFATTPADERLVYPDAPSARVVYASVPDDLAICLSKAQPDVANFDYLYSDLSIEVG
ncbi:transglutaminase-like domain-containing protein [Actinospica robiniae]|uniref:transglutaminase-like domain-containing protein n=1 Tax=Actinospica robiniae TaxID=304901 RepID=UPI00041FB5C8|nr:transglutaminase family protein [Actinospica robiniae]